MNLQSTQPTNSPPNINGIISFAGPEIRGSVNKWRQAGGVRGLLTEAGLEFLYTHVMDNKVIRPWLETTEDVTWYLCWIKTGFERPGNVICWNNARTESRINTRVVLILNGEAIFYEGSDTLERSGNKFGQFQISQAVLNANMDNKKVRGRRLEGQEGGFILYDGCMGYEQVQGGHIAVGLCGEEELKEVSQGVPVLPESLRGIVDKFNKLSKRIKFGFRFVQTT